MQSPQRIKCRNYLYKFLESGGSIVVESRCILHREKFSMKIKNNLIINIDIGIIDNEGNILHADIYCGEFAIQILTHKGDESKNIDFRVRGEDYIGKIVSIKADDINLAFEDSKTMDSIKTIIFANRNTRICNQCSIEVPQMCRLSLAKHLGIVSEEKPYKSIYLQQIDEASMGKYIIRKYKWSLSQSISIERLNIKDRVDINAQQFRSLDARLWGEVNLRKKCMKCGCIFRNVCPEKPYCKVCMEKCDGVSFYEDIWEISENQEILRKRFVWLENLGISNGGVCAICREYPKLTKYNGEQNFFVKWGNEDKSCCYKCFEDKCKGW